MAPSVPVLNAPVNGATVPEGIPDFDWTDSTGADLYVLQVGSTGDFSRPVISTTVSSSNYTPGSALPAGTYSWRVQAGDTSGSRSTWSEVQTFTTGTVSASFQTTQDPYPLSQATPTNPPGYPLPPTSLPATAPPAATSIGATPPVPTPRLSASPTSGRSLTPRPSGTPRPTGTLIPLPEITLLFPAITPTQDGLSVALQASAPSPTPEAGSAGLIEASAVAPRIGLLGTVIVAIWALLGGFLFAYLRHLGY